MKPVIGIIARINDSCCNNSALMVTESCRKMILALGGLPIVILPPQLCNYREQKVSQMPTLTMSEKALLDESLALCDAILLPGGQKIFEYDTYIVNYAIKNDVPLLGVCLGFQVMANYGKEIWNEKNTIDGINHFAPDDEYVHEVILSRNSKLYQIIKKVNFKVNSLHRMHVTDSPFYDVVGYSEDDLIEAVECSKNMFNIGVQWHPEIMYSYDENAKKLCEAFLNSAIQFQKNKLSKKARQKV